MNYGFIIDDMIWSHSRIDTFDRCPKCFFLQYIKAYEGAKGVFGQFGSLCHDILEKYAKGKLEEYELSSEYRNNFDKIITCAFPPNKWVDLRESYYCAGLNFFDNFEGYDMSKIRGIESEYNFKVGKYIFTGKIDLETDDIVDYKTKKACHLVKLTKNHDKSNYITLNDGRYLKFEDIVQLVLYCIPYKNQYKKYPKKLILDMIKANDKYVLDFDKTLLKKAITWAENKIQEIYNTKDFQRGKECDQFWCDFTCSQRYNCEHSSRYSG